MLRGPNETAKHTRRRRESTGIEELPVASKVITLSQKLLPSPTINRFGSCDFYAPLVICKSVIREIAADTHTLLRYNVVTYISRPRKIEEPILFCTTIYFPSLDFPLQSPHLGEHARYILVAKRLISVRTCVLCCITHRFIYMKLMKRENGIYIYIYTRN